MKTDKELFWQLLAPEYDKTMIYCRKIMQNREQGDDLFQDSLLIGIRKFSQLRDVNSFRPWLYQIINSRFKSIVRASKKRTWSHFSTEVEESLPRKQQTEFPLANIWLERILKTLSPDEQTLIVLHELEQWRISELAALKKTSEGAIKLKLFRIRNKMKKQLTRMAGSDKTSINDVYGELNVYVM